MSVLDPIYIREPGEKSVPNGGSNPSVDLTGLATDLAFWPFSAVQLSKRLASPVEQSVATGSVVTNDSPGFLSGFSREVGKIYDDSATAANTAARGVGSFIGNLLPWWLWAIVGLGLLAYIIGLLAPVLRRAP